jgi:hypothetical protein
MFVERKFKEKGLFLGRLIRAWRTTRGDWGDFRPLCLKDNGKENYMK